MPMCRFAVHSRFMTDIRNRRSGICSLFWMIVICMASSPVWAQKHTEAHAEATVETSRLEAWRTGQRWTCSPSERQKAQRQGDYLWRDLDRVMDFPIETGSSAMLSWVSTNCRAMWRIIPTSAPR